MDEVRLPAPNVTKVAPGGEDLRTAYATTASVGFDAADRAAQPQAGQCSLSVWTWPANDFLPARLG